jgi:Zn-finger domain-containing protein
MGARAGWRWISVVVMGRFPVRLSLRAASYVLQDKRRRVRIIRRAPVYTVFGDRFSLSISLDRRSRLSGKFMSARLRASFTKLPFDQYRRERRERD